MAAFLAPVIISLSLLFIDCGGSPQSTSAEASTSSKGSVQLSFTGSVSATSGLAFQSLLLNVISVRLNPSSDLNISEADPGWQIIAAPIGATAGESLPSLTLGGNFGPNGNAVGVGLAQSELQIDLALLQNSVVLFNTGKVRAISYGQIELLLDPSTPGYVVPQCGVGTSTGEGCVSYPLQFSSGFTSIRTATPFTVTRNTPQSLVLDISAVLGAGPASSTSPVFFAPSICAVPASGTSGCPGAPFTPLTQDQISAVITDTVTGATAKTVVNAERPGTSQIVASATVYKVGGSYQYSMILPAPAPSAGASPALYDFFTTTVSRTQDPHAAVPVFAGIYSSPLPSPDPFHFNIVRKATKAVSGAIFDACTGQVIPGATIDLFAPASLVGTEDCTVSGAPAPCTTTCGQFVNNPDGNDIPPGCVIVGSTSSRDTGVYPMPGNSGQFSAFSVIPLVSVGQEDALRTTASGYNGEILGLSNKSNALVCQGSLYSKNACNFSLQHGTLDVTADIDTSTGAVVPTSPLNVLVNVEDHGTFDGEAVGTVTIPAGQPSNSVAVQILVPVSPPTPQVNPTPTATTTASATPTPVVIGGAASYDLFASVQDIFGSAPQKVSGHQIAVLGNVAAPGLCQTSASSTLAGLACVGHGSIAGTIASPDANSLVVVSKLDPTNNSVALMSDRVPLVTTNPNFAICAPADSYVLAHYEATPGGTPIAGASTAVSLATPIILNSPPVTTTPTPVPCAGICSDFSQSNSGQSCYLCQASGVIPNPF